MSSTKLVAIVTGCATGLGHAIVKELLVKGYRVCMAEINKEKGHEAMEAFHKEFGKEQVTFMSCDVTSKEKFKDVFEHTLSTYQKVDLLVNNAGILDETQPEKTVAINLMGVIYGCNLAFKYMGKDSSGKGGIVLNTASIAGLIPFESAAVYGATKHGVVGLTRSYGTKYHYDKSGIIFCALCPFYIDTPLLLQFPEKSLVPGMAPFERPDVMTTSYVAKGAMMLLEDKKNGSTLVVTDETRFGYKYIGVGELENFQA